MSDSFDPFRFFYPWRVRYSEVDPQQIVFNSRYLEYADAAGTEYFRELGFSPLDLPAAHNLNMVVAHTEIDYLSPARLDDLLHVFVRTAKLGGTSFTTQFEIRRAADGEILTRIVIKYVNLDESTGRSMSLPESFRRAVAAYEKQPVPS